MNPSEIFILRPVATTLLMVAILLAGMFAYNFLPLSALPEVDYPTIQVQTFYPGASPEVMTSAVTAPLERQFGQMPGLNQMTSASSGGASVITLAVQPRSQPRHRRAGGAGGDQRGGQSASPGSSGAAGLRQGQSGRRADHDAGRHVEVPAADRNRRPRRNPSGAKAVAAARRRPRQHKRRPAPRHSHPVQSERARRLWAEHRRFADDAQQQQHQHAQGRLRRPATILDDQRQRSDRRRGEVRRCHRRLSQWQSRPRQRRGERAAWTGKQQDRGMGQFDARDHSQYPATAGRQRHSGRGHDQEAAAEIARVPPGRVGCDGAERPNDDDPRFGRGCRVRTWPRGRSGRSRHIRLFAQSARDHYSQSLRAAVARRHIGRHVFAKIQSRQSFADGADDLHRLRRRRRDRDDRKHRALHRGRRGAVAGRAARLAADRLHHHLLNRVA